MKRIKEDFYDTPLERETEKKKNYDFLILF